MKRHVLERVTKRMLRRFGQLHLLHYFTWKEVWLLPAACLWITMSDWIARRPWPPAIKD